MVSSEDLLEKENQWVSDEGECSIGFTPSSTSVEDQEQQQPSQVEKNAVIENLEKATSSLSVESLASMKTNELFEAHQKLLSMANAVATAMKRRCSSPDKSWWLDFIRWMDEIYYKDMEMTDICTYLWLLIEWYYWVLCTSYESSTTHLLVHMEDIDCWIILICWNSCARGTDIFLWCMVSCFHSWTVHNPLFYKGSYVRV